MSLKNINKYKNLNSIIILGGSSIVPYLKKIKDLKKKYIIFLEARAITPLLIKTKIKVDYILCPYPQKLKDNGLQNYILRSLCSNVDIKKFIKKKYHKEVNYLKKNFLKIFETWNPKKGVYKNYKIKENIYLKNSPFELLKHYKDTKIILDTLQFKKEFPNKKISNKIIKIGFNENNKKFSIKNYLNPKIKDNKLNLITNNFLNVATTSILPIISKMGFKNTFLLGMDMNMLGTMEYSVKNIFKSFFHFIIFFLLSKKAFNHNFKVNFPLIYLRPKSEFLDFKKILPFFRKNIFNVNDNSIFIGKIKNINQISYQNFFKK
jgi:hypothetical protein